MGGGGHQPEGATGGGAGGHQPLDPPLLLFTAGAGGVGRSIAGGGGRSGTTGGGLHPLAAVGGVCGVWGGHQPVWWPVGLPKATTGLALADFDVPLVHVHPPRSRFLFSIRLLLPPRGSSLGRGCFAPSDFEEAAARLSDRAHRRTAAGQFPRLRSDLLRFRPPPLLFIILHPSAGEFRLLLLLPHGLSSGRHIDSVDSPPELAWSGSAPPGVSPSSLEQPSGQAGSALLILLLLFLISIDRASSSLVPV